MPIQNPDGSYTLSAEEMERIQNGEEITIDPVSVLGGFGGGQAAGGGGSGILPDIPMLEGQPSLPQVPSIPTFDGISAGVNSAQGNGAAAGLDLAGQIPTAPAANPAFMGIPGLQTLGPIAAAAAIGPPTASGVSKLGSEGFDADLSTREKAALALPTFGASFVFDKLGFGSGKSKDQQVRDQAREGLVQAGIANAHDGDVFVTLADGSEVSVGQDGGAKFIGHDGETEFSSAYDIDTSHPLHNQATALVDPLVHAMFPDNETARVGMATQLTNAILSNVGEGDLDQLKANASGLYKQAGISPSDLRGQLSQLSDSGAIPKDSLQVFQDNISELTGRATGGGSVLGAIAGGNQAQGEGRKVTGNILWKPQSESDGNLVVLFPYRAGAVVIKDKESGQIIDTGRSTGPSNGYADTVRFSRPGSSFKNVVMEDSAGNVFEIGDGAQRIENLSGSGLAGSMGAGSPFDIFSNISSQGGLLRDGRGGRKKGKKKKKGRGSKFQVSQAPKEQKPPQPAPKSVGDFVSDITKQRNQNQGL